MARIEAALAGLNACVTELAPEQALDETLLRRFGDKWREALAKTYEPFSDDWLDHWRYLADGASQEPWRSLCLLAMAQSLNRDGYHDEALDVADEAHPDGPAADALKQRLSLARAQAHLGLRELTEAGRRAEWAAAGPDRVVASEAMLLRARAAEMSLDLPAALQAYTMTSHESVIAWDRRLAEYGVTRVDQLGECEVATDAPWLSVLTDDRTTLGDWRIGYGATAAVLCAMNAPFDIVVPAGAKIECKVSTTDPDEPSRRWVTAKESDCPSALFNPWTRERRPANWDDRGEQYAIGDGPDLLVSVKVPAGPHVLGLYFLNDPVYYEPSRSYTISVMDDQDKLVAITEVAHFGGGVYKRLAVTGPQEVRLHIWRDLSMNALLSGVFLDPVSGVRPAPHERKLPEALERMTKGVGGTQPAALARAARAQEVWAASEFARMAGRHRTADELFREYLLTLVGEDGSDTAILRVVLGKQLKDARHARAEITADMYIHYLKLQHADSPPKRLTERLVDLTRLAGSRDAAPICLTAHAALREHAPEVADEAESVRSKARALQYLRRTAEAVELLQVALASATDPDEQAEMAYLTVGWLAGAKSPPEELQPAYDRLMALVDEDSREAKHSLAALALSYYDAKQFDRAAELLTDYEKRFGPGTFARGLLEDIN